MAGGRTSVAVTAVRSAGTARQALALTWDVLDGSDASKVTVELRAEAWAEPVRFALPLALLCVGAQDVSLRVPRVGNLCLAVECTPSSTDKGVSAAPELTSSSTGGKAGSAQPESSQESQSKKPDPVPAPELKPEPKAPPEPMPETEPEPAPEPARESAPTLEPERAPVPAGLPSVPEREAAHVPSSGAAHAPAGSEAGPEGGAERPAAEVTDEEEEDEGEEPLATLSGTQQLGSMMQIDLPDELRPSADAKVQLQWHRSIDGDSWEAVRGATEPRYMLSADDVGHWLFAEWRFTDAAGEVLADGSTEQSSAVVGILAEDRDDLKDLVLKGEASFEVRVREGVAELRLSRDGLRLSHRHGGTSLYALDKALLRAMPQNPLGVLITRSDSDEPLKATLASTQQRDLLVLTATAYHALTIDASHQGACRVWEGDEYGPYYGRLHGQHLLLFEGAEAPGADTAPNEALMLHGITAEAVAASEDGDADELELSLADADGEVFSLAFSSDAEREEWRSAIDSRDAPAAIARASHILLKHEGSRRLASWRDPNGVSIRARTRQAAEEQLLEYREQIVGGSSLSALAEAASDCDTAQHGGDLGWFAAGCVRTTPLS